MKNPFKQNPNPVEVATKGPYTLNPQAFPYVEIRISEGIIVSPGEDDEKSYMPQSILVELPTGKMIQLDELVDDYMEQFRVNEAASKIPQTG